MTNLLYKDEVYAIIGASMDVYNELGPGFLEAVYQEATEIELTRRGIPFVSQPELPIFYKGERLKKYYIADFLIYDKIMIEIKALKSLTSHEEAQLLNELKITRTKLGLLINFGSDQKLEWKRRIYTKN
jgi:GxxExxY protein